MSMDNELLIEAFKKSTEYVLRTMTFIEAKAQEVLTKNDKDLSGDVSGIIGMTSPEKRVSLALTFSKAAALKVHSSMLGDELEEITPEAGDTVGELTNIICGQARKILHDEGFIFEASIPMVVIGEGQSIHPIGATSTVIPFLVDGLPLFIEISVEK
jgi:chemotaxis protein CheX